MDTEEIDERKIDYLANATHIRKTVLELLTDRGYVVEQEEFEKLSDYEQHFGYPDDTELLQIQTTHKDDPLRSLYVFYDNNCGTVPLSAVREYKDKMEQNQVRHAILITKAPLTPAGKKVVAQLLPNMRIELFLWKELKLNVTKHFMYSKHVALTPLEKAELLKEKNVKEHQFPKLRQDDPVSRYFGFRPGQMIKIYRKSVLIPGFVIAYRLVIN